MESSFAGEHQEDALTLTTVILCVFSCACCVYVCINIKLSGVDPCHICSRSLYYVCCCFVSTVSSDQLEDDEFVASKLSPDVTSDIIFWLCVTDFLHCVQITIMQIPQLLEISFFNDSECKVIAAFGQFLTTQWVCWHFALAMTLGILLISTNTGRSVELLSKYKFIIYIFIFIIPSISTIIPLPAFKMFSGDYGKMGGDTIWYNECWIPIQGWLLVYIITISFSLVLHLIVDIIAIAKWFKIKRRNFYQYERSRVVVIKLSRFVVAFTLIRIPSVAFRFWQYWIFDTTPPFWIVLLHYIGVSSVGIANGIVWFWNQKLCFSFFIFLFDNRYRI